MKSENRRLIIGTNWKMNHGPKEAANYAKRLLELVKSDHPTDIFIIPPVISLPAVAEILKGSHIRYGIQNIHWKTKGAYTGEVSALMAKEVGCYYAEIGHSERRYIFRETDEMINLKIKAALSAGLVPLLCIGETKKAYQDNQAKQYIGNQLLKNLQGLNKERVEKILFAYEPVWAIGEKGNPAEPAYANDIIGFIREFIKKQYNNRISQKMRIIYGGNVDLTNAPGFINQPQVDGLFVGRAALDPEVLYHISLL